MRGGGPNVEIIFSFSNFSTLACGMTILSVNDRYGYFFGTYRLLPLPADYILVFWCVE